MGLISIDGYEPKHLSYSTISGYRMCGAKFRFEKIFRLEQIPGLAAIGGNAVHVASQIVDEFILEHGFDALDSEDIIELDIQRRWICDPSGSGSTSVDPLRNDNN